ncbi:MAG: pilus assembly protein PilP [Burkholderiales bacterium]
MIRLLNFKYIHGASLLLVLASLSACLNDKQELEIWMQEQRAEVKPSIEPIEPPKRFIPHAYEVFDKHDPFDPVKKMEAVIGGEKHPCSLLLAEQSRQRQPLEAYPIDTMVMVGSYVKNNQPYALLSVSGHLYIVKTGDYIGKNYGKITSVTESQISLREIGQDPSGECEERPGTLQIPEKSR